MHLNVQKSDQENSTKKSSSFFGKSFKNCITKSMQTKVYSIPYLSQATGLYYSDGSITIDELIDYLVAEAEELKLDTLKVRPKALTIIPGPGSLVASLKSFHALSSIGYDGVPVLISRLRGKRGIENG